MWGQKFKVGFTGFETKVSTEPCFLWTSGGAGGGGGRESLFTFSNFYNCILAFPQSVAIFPVFKTSNISLITVFFFFSIFTSPSLLLLSLSLAPSYRDTQWLLLEVTQIVQINVLTPDKLYAFKSSVSTYVEFHSLQGLGYRYI